MSEETIRNGATRHDVTFPTWAEMVEQSNAERAALKANPPVSPSDDKIEDAWKQCTTELRSPVNPNSLEDREEDSSSGLDEGFQSIREEYCPEQPTGQPEQIPQPEEPLTAAEEAIAEAVRRSGDRSTGLTEQCPLYIINRALANCRVLTSTERCCIGLLNSLMQKHGYAFVSNEQLALWLCMKSPDTVRNMLARLTKMGFIANTGRRHLEIRWVVCQELQNPKRKSR